MQDLGRLEYAVDLAPLPTGTPVTDCPDPSCDARTAGPGRIIKHHPDGSHTMDWGGNPPRLVESVDGVDVMVTVTGATLRSTRA